MKKTRILLLLLAFCLLFSACSTGVQKPEQKSEKTQETASESTETASKAEGEKILHVAESFAYPSLDPHKDYYGWYTQIYGMSENLFRLADDSSLEPCLAEKAELSEDGLTWTIYLKEGVKFSNNEPLTAEMVVKNLQRIAENQKGAAFLKDWEMQAIDERSLSLKSEKAYPILKNDLARPEFAMVDLDNSKDLDMAPICTGPFVVKSFVPEGTVEVVRNVNYWGGEVKLDGAVFNYMADDESKLMAMQNGEIDGYTSVTAAAMEIYKASPEQYKLTEIPATRLQFYALNKARLSDAVTAAVNRVVDPAAIAAFLKGTVSPAIGPFSPKAAYGQVSKPAVDVAEAKKLLEADGYSLNADGLYEKDGQVLELNICFYKARSLDSVAVLMQDQLKAAGIAAKLTAEEDPDATYVQTHDFDIALYCMIADLSGDPYNFIKTTLKKGEYFDIGSYSDDEVEKMIAELEYTVDPAERAKLANQIIQKAIDANAYGYVGLFNKTTVQKPQVLNFSENSPFDCYRLNAATDLQD